MRQMTRTMKRWNTWIPKSRTGRLLVAGLALCCFLGSAYAMSLSASRDDKDARGFIQKYQYVDQSAYRTR